MTRLGFLFACALATSLGAQSLTDRFKEVRGPWEVQLERERKRRVEKELAESRLAEQEGLRREEKQRETISKLEAKIAAIELDIAAHRLMARTRASPPAPPTPPAKPPSKPDAC